MITLKLKFKTNELNILKNDERIYSSIVRYSYNRFKEKSLSQTEIYQDLVSKFKDFPSHLITSAMREGKSIYSLNKDKKVCFGKLKQYNKKLISKEEYQSSRNRGFTSEGSSAKIHHGNQYFKIDLNENKIIYKRSRNVHIDLNLYILNKRNRTLLALLKESMQNSTDAVTFKIKDDYVFITYDESKINLNEKFKDLKTNRVIGLDLNPNYIGLSVLEFNKNDEFKVLYKQGFDLSNLNVTSKKSSTDKSSKYLTNKRKFELIQVCYEINKLINYWKCSKLCIEDLNIKSSNKKQGRTFNRLCNNVWNRNLVVNKLKMLSVIYGYELIEVNPAYSSFIGNLLYGNENTPDMIASSIEIARRGFKKFSKGWFYPIFSIEHLNEQWKQTLSGIEDWKSAFNQIKKSKLKYRFQLIELIQNAVFSKIYKQKKIKLYCFI